MYGVCLAFLRNYRPWIWSWLVKWWPMGLVATVGLAAYSWFHFMTVGMFTTESVVARVFFFCFSSASLALAFPKVAEMTAPDGWIASVVRSFSLWSYSIYLSHTVSGGFFVLIFNHRGWSIHGWNAVVISSLVWITTVPCSAALYHFFEKPVMDLRNKPLRRAKA
jgi:peptidoglycan/LPS O-acetylase OafA/YrhL